MTESKYAEPTREITAILDSLEKDTAFPAEKETPRIELIDFDRVVQLLRDARDLMEAETHAEAELTHLKMWMSNKIKGWRRAHALLKNKIHGADPDPGFEVQSAGELIREFDEAGKALRAASGAYVTQRFMTDSNDEKYRSFKS